MHTLRPPTTAVGWQGNLGRVASFNMKLSRSLMVSSNPTCNSVCLWPCVARARGSSSGSMKSARCPPECGNSSLGVVDSVTAVAQRVRGGLALQAICLYGVHSPTVLVRARADALCVLCNLRRLVLIQLRRCLPTGARPSLMQRRTVAASAQGCCCRKYESAHACDGVQVHEASSPERCRWPDLSQRL